MILATNRGLAVGLAALAGIVCAAPGALATEAQTEACVASIGSMLNAASGDIGVEAETPLANGAAQVMLRTPTGTARCIVDGENIVLESSVAAGGAPVEPAAPAAGSVEEDVWRIVTVSDQPAKGEASIAFAADGSLSGSTGCNNFSGTGAIDAGRIVVAPLATTKMLCPGPAIQAQEAAVLRVLQSSPNYEFDPFAERLTLTEADADPAGWLELARGR